MPRNTDRQPGKLPGETSEGILDGKTEQWDGVEPVELPDWVDPDVPPSCSLYVPDKRFRPDYEDVPGVATFKSHGVPVKGRGGEMVLVSLGGDKDWAEAMCSTEDFSARLGWKCPHGLMGWACKKCLSEEEVRRLA